MTTFENIVTTEELAENKFMARFEGVVSAAVLNDVVNNSLAQQFRNRRVNGFRKGKADIRTLRTLAGKDTWDYFRNRVATQEFIKWAREEKLDIVGQLNPTVEESKLGKDTHVIIECDLIRDIALKPVGDEEVEVPIAEVTDEDFQKRIDKIRRAKNTWTETDEHCVEGDRVNISFVGKIDGKPFPGGKSMKDGFTMTLGETRMIDGFSEKIVGHKKGDKFQIDVTFPENYGEDFLRGKPAVFDVDLNKVERGTMPELDDVLAKELGYESADDLMTKTRSIMEESLAKTIEAKTKAAIIDKFIDINTIEVPKKQVQERIADIRKRQVGKRYESQSDVDEIPDEIYEKQAELEVLRGALFGHVIAQQELEVDDESIEAKVDELRKRFGKAQFDQLTKMNPGYQQELMSANLNDQAADWIVSTATNLKHIGTTFEELVAE